MQQEFIINDEGYKRLYGMLQQMNVWSDDVIVARPRLEMIDGKLTTTDETDYLVNEGIFRKNLKSVFGSDSLLEGVFPYFEYKPDTVVADTLHYYDLIVVDEMSMVGETMVQHLEAVKALATNHYKTVLAGDPGQLPPVNETLNHFFASDIHSENAQQITLSKILRSTDTIANVAQAIRLGVDIKQLKNIDPNVIMTRLELEPFTQSNMQLLKDCDIAIAYTNRDVNYLNHTIRMLKGYDGSTIKAGERLMATSNSVRDMQGFSSFSNGDELIVNHVYSNDDAVAKADAYLQTILTHKDPAIQAKGILIRTQLQVGAITLIEVKDRTGRNYDVVVRTDFTNWKDDVILNTIKADLADIARVTINPLRFLDATFGYARTIHKSQGSEWDNVLMWLSSKNLYAMKMQDPKSVKSLIYTGYTRAAKEIHLVYSDRFN